MNLHIRFGGKAWVLLLPAVLLLLTLWLGLSISIAEPVRATDFQSSSALAQTSASPLCRFGVNALGDITEFDTSLLRIGWYIDYKTTGVPTPAGAEYAPVIRLTQIGANGYSSNPSGSQLLAAVAAHPGADWMIGNEPDRRNWQDDLEPHIYARAYHDLYYLIKTADPSAKIFAGTIVQPTPVRLQYLDMVLSSYHSAYDDSMPVDGWSIHNFILNEANEDRCDEVPPGIGCWGAGIPPGINVLLGEVVTIQENDSISRFKSRISQFRQWMYDRGYGHLPLYVSEYGILMPQDFGFDSTRVNAYMNATFDYMRTKSDPVLGDPNDGDRLVQKWSWYSTSDSIFNGWLFEQGTKQFSSMGTNYAGYTAALSEEVDFYPSRIFADPPAPFTQGQNVTFTLKTRVSNSGNLALASGPVNVRFYDGDPMNGGTQIGTVQTVSLAGCGDTQTAGVTWSDVAPGTHLVYVVVDDGNVVPESNEQNNTAVQTILVATKRIFLPTFFR